MQKKADTDDDIRFQMTNTLKNIETFFGINKEILDKNMPYEKRKKKNLLKLLK